MQHQPGRYCENHILTAISANDQSLVATTIATLISVGLALTLAWCVNRTHIRYKAIFSMLFTLPMLIPSISHGMGLVLLLGDNGILTNALGLDIGLYGYPGIIIGSVLYSFPVAFLIIFKLSLG